MADNIRCKISALSEPNWTAESIRPYLFHCIEKFGVECSFFASNWPFDWLFGTFDNLVKAYH